MIWLNLVTAVKLFFFFFKLRKLQYRWTEHLSLESDPANEPTCRPGELGQVTSPLRPNHLLPQLRQQGRHLEASSRTNYPVPVHPAEPAEEGGVACQRRLRLQNQVLMSLERHVQDRGTARERGGASGIEGRGGRGTSGPSLWPPLPQDAQNSQARGKPNRSSRSCPPAQPLDPRKAVKPSQSLSRGVWRGLPKPCSPRGAGSTAAWRPQTHHLPRRDSLTGPGLPKLRPGAAAPARSSRRVPPLRLPRPLRARRWLWAYGTSFLRASDPPRTSQVSAQQTIGPEPRRFLAAAATCPASPTQSEGSGARDWESPLQPPPGPRELSRAQPAPAGRRPGRTAFQPRRSWNVRLPEARAWERGWVVTQAATGSDSGTKAVRVREHAHRTRRSSAGGRRKSACQSPPPGTGQIPGLYFPEVSTPHEVKGTS